jgi:glycosyltransferase involved in cell wall biosynthesis
MKILYDYQIFTKQNYGGVSRYFYELMDNLRVHKIDIEIPINYSKNIYIKEADFLSKPLKGYTEYKDFLFGLRPKGKAKIYKLLQKLNFIKNAETANQKISIERLKKQNFDIFHPTYYDPYFLKHIGKKPFVLTIYDMIHETYPELFSADNKIARQKKILAQKADKIIAISENTKKDIIKFIGINEDKIQVIHLGSSINRQENNLEMNTDLLKKLPEKYILFVGNRTSYKNFDNFSKALIPLFKINKKLNAVCAGGGEFSDKEINFFKTFNITDKFRQYSVNDSDMTLLYKNALVFVFPSLYEGFGLPILEAFNCGCPVAASNRGSLPEIAGNAAAYFNPEDISSITDAINNIIADDGTKEKMKKNGFEQLKNFSWEKTAEKTLAVYNSILNNTL